MKELGGRGGRFGQREGRVLDQKSQFQESKPAVGHLMMIHDDPKDWMQTINPRGFGVELADTKANVTWLPSVEPSRGRSRKGKVSRFRFPSDQNSQRPTQPLRRW